MGDFSALLIALGVCNTAGSKEERGRGRGWAAQMYGKEVILKCEGSVTAVVDLLVRVLQGSNFVLVPFA